MNIIEMAREAEKYATEKFAAKKIRERGTA